MKSVLGWAAVSALLLFEGILFRRFLLREVIWAYPPNTDQAAYLQQTYELYERMKSHGTWQAVAHQPVAPQGACMQLEAALLFRVIGGGSRFAALLPNFIYFALLQIALVWSLRWLTGGWNIAFLGLGLLLTARSPFNTAGGIYDFRMDFIAFCLYGMFLCCAIRSNLFARTRWSAVAGLCGTALICFRFITSAYLAPLLVLVGVTAIVGSVRGPVARRRQSLERLRGTLAAPVVILLLAGPVLWSHRQAIHDYYVVNHVTGAEKDVRAAETGTTRLVDALVYYPTSPLSHF